MNSVHSVQGSSLSPVLTPDSFTPRVISGQKDRIPPSDSALMNRSTFAHVCACRVQVRASPDSPPATPPRLVANGWPTSRDPMPTRSPGSFPAKNFR